MPLLITGLQKKKKKKKMNSKIDSHEMEETLKKKPTDIIKNMSRVELKKFTKGEYQKLVPKELKQFLPNIEGSKLKETAQYISNALDRQAKSQLNSETLDSVATRKASTLLSDIVIAELDTTHCVDPTQPPAVTERSGHEEAEIINDDDTADTDVSDDDITFDSQVDPLTGDNKSDLNDSITQLKQLVCNDDEVPANFKQQKQHQMSPTLMINKYAVKRTKNKPNSNKFYDMTRCTLWER